MCQQCVNNLIDILPDAMPWSERMHILWEYTAYPMGDAETVGRQIKEFADGMCDAHAANL